MSRLLSLDEKDAVCSLLSVRANRKRLLDSGDSESSDSYSQSGSSSQCKDTSNSTESDPDGRASKDTFQFQHIIDFDPATVDRMMRKPVIKKKMVCECGAIILTRTEWKHKQTNKHIQFILRKRAQQEQGPSGMQHQVHHTPLSVQQRPSQEKQKRYRESPPPVSANLGDLTDILPAEPQLQLQLRPPLQQQQQQQLSPASLRSHDHTGPLSMQKMQDTHTQVAQHTDLAVPSTSIFTEMYSCNPQLPPFGSSRHMDLGQQTSDVCSSQRPYNVGMRERGLAPHYLRPRIDQPEVYDSIGGWHHAFQPQTPLGDRRISELGQQQPQWYIAAVPLHQRQCYRIPTAPEIRFFDSDYSASLSNFPINSFY
eukprot:gene30705-39989_t